MMSLTLHYDHHSFTPSISQFSSVIMGPPEPLRSDSTNDNPRTPSTDDHSQPLGHVSQDAESSGNLRTYLLPPSSSSHAESSSATSNQLTASTVPSPVQELSSSQTFPRASPGSDEEPQPDPHIPRAPNAFILFRSHMIRTEAIPKTVAGRHSDLSKIIGAVWKGLSEEERSHWEKEAKDAQTRHRLKYPNWRFAPGIQQGQDFTKRASKPRKRKRTNDSEPPPVQRKKLKRRMTSPPQGVKKEQPDATDANSNVVHAPALPVPYEFTLPLKAPGGSRPSFSPRPITRKQRSLPLPTSQERLRLARRGAISLNTDLSGQASTSAVEPPPQVSPVYSSPSPVVLSAVASSSTAALPPCQWTGHELEGSPIVGLVEHSDPSGYPYTVGGFDHFSLPFPTPPLFLSGATHDPTSQQSFLPPSRYSPYEPYNLPSPPSVPTNDNLDYSESILPLTQRYRRGLLENAGSPLSQSHSFSDLVNNNLLPSSGDGDAWPSVNHMTSMPDSWNDQPQAGPSSIHSGYAFSSAVSGGQPLREELAYHPGDFSQAPDGVSSSFTHFDIAPQYASAYHHSPPGASELAHALHFDNHQVESPSRHNDSPPDPAQ